MTSLDQMSVEELATYVAEQLRRRGIDAVLTGGSCVTIYSRNRYASYDLDFIETPSVPRNRLGNRKLLYPDIFPQSRIYTCSQRGISSPYRLTCVSLQPETVPQEVLSLLIFFPAQV